MENELINEHTLKVGGLSILLYLILALVFMGLWNFFIPQTFHNAPQLTYFQSVGIILLAKLCKL
jgi:hypothetical protein